jgi:6-phosphofructokinase 1
MEKEKLKEILLVTTLALGSILLFRKYRRKPGPIVNPLALLRRSTNFKLRLEEHKCILEDQDKGLLSPRLLSIDQDNIILNPMLGTGMKTDVNSGKHFMPESVFLKVGGYINADSAFSPEYLKGKSINLVKGAPRKEIVMNPKGVKAAIITCGGLCPGLNVVIREIVMSLYYNYESTEIYGIVNGYKGFYTPGSIIKLTPKDVLDIHTKGGTILKSSRGGWDLKKIMSSIDEHEFNQIYIIGGDGTHRGISALVEEVSKLHKHIAIVGIPKTIDNDIPIIDKSFGFDTSVGEAQRAIDSADVEANSVENGIGLVKLMGRNSGFIALHSSISSRDVNLCLIPECEYELNGPNGVYSYIVNRLRKKGHAVIVVAEGAATGCLDEKLENSGKDASGNPILFDIGKHLKEGIVKHCKSVGIEPTLKYIDPTYMIRTVPANSSDKMLCTMLAQAAVHGAFAGFTGFSVGTVANQVVYIPVELMTTIHEGKNSTPGQRKVDIDNNMMWWRLVASTGQPSFRNHS